jgi:hypothetical protein
MGWDLSFFNFPIKSLCECESLPLMQGFLYSNHHSNCSLVNFGLPSVLRGDFQRKKSI